MASWSGGYVKRARKHVASMLPAPCWRCGRWLYADEPQTWVAGHIIERDLAPELAHDPENWAPECRPCSDRSGAVYGNRKRGRAAPPPTSRRWVRLRGSGF